MRPLCFAMTLVILAACGSGDEPAAPEQPGDESADAPTTSKEAEGNLGGAPLPPPRIVDPVDEARALVSSPDEEVRQIAADKLGAVAERDRERAAIVLESMLGDASADVRQVVANSIANLGLPRLGAMRDRLRREEDDDVRQALVRAIFKVGGADAIPDLLTAANDVMVDENFRAFAIDALGRLQATKGRVILEEASEDISPVVRRAAVIALGQIAADASLKCLGARVGDNDSSVRIEAIRALKMMNKRHGVRYLIDNLESDDEEVLDELVDALERITGKKQGYDKTKSAAENAGSIKKWLSWWEENKSYY